MFKRCGNVSASYASSPEITSGKFFRGGGVFLPSADSRRASCQLLANECALSTGKLPPGGLPRNRVDNQIDKTQNVISFILNEPRHEKTGFLHMRKQRRRSASR